MKKGYEAQDEAVKSGHYPLYRYNPELTAQGKNPFILDSKKPTMKFSEHALKENRFRVLTNTKPENSKALLATADRIVEERFAKLEKMAEQ